MTVLPEAFESQVILNVAGAIGFVSLLPFLSLQAKSTLAVGAGIAGFGVAGDCTISNIVAHVLFGIAASLPIIAIVSAAGAFADVTESGRGMTIGLSVDPFLDFPEQALSLVLRVLAFTVSVHAFTLTYPLDLSVVRPIIELSILFLAQYGAIEILFLGMGRLLPLVSFQAQLFALKAVAMVTLLWWSTPSLLARLVP